MRPRGQGPTAGQGIGCVSCRGEGLAEDSRDREAASATPAKPCCDARTPGCPRREAPPLIVAAVHVKTMLSPGSSTNEVVAASVVHLNRVRTDGPMSQASMGTSLRACTTCSSRLSTCRARRCWLPPWPACLQCAQLPADARPGQHTQRSRIRLPPSPVARPWPAAGGVEQRFPAAPLQRRAPPGRPAFPHRYVGRHAACPSGFSLAPVHLAGLEPPCSKCAPSCMRRRPANACHMLLLHCRLRCRGAQGEPV